MDVPDKVINPLAVDSREPKNMDALIKAAGVPAERMMMDVGDYRFFDKEGALILVTRKGSDLLDSVHSGHMQDEFDRCIKAIQAYGSGKLFFLIEGAWSISNMRAEGGGLAYFARAGNDWFRKMRSHGTAQSVLANMQISAQSAGCYFLWTGTTHETAIALAALYKRGIEGWPTKLTQGLARPPLRWSRDGRVAHLRGLWPRLREDMAVRILKEIGGIGAIVDAARNEPDRLLAIKGLGKAGLQNLQDVL